MQSRSNIPPRAERRSFLEGRYTLAPFANTGSTVASVVLNPVPLELRLLETNGITTAHINKIKHYYPPYELEFPVETDPDDSVPQDMPFSNQTPELSRSHAYETGDSAEPSPSGLQEGYCNDRKDVNCISDSDILLYESDDDLAPHDLEMLLKKLSWYWEPRGDLGQVPPLDPPICCS